MKDKYKVLIASLGRSHYVVAATYLARAGVDVSEIPGWAPKSENDLLVKLASKIMRRKSFVPGLMKRVPKELEGRTISVPWAELIQTALFMSVGRLGQAMHSLCARFAYQVFGWETRRYLCGYDIYHVRSGSGRGGAIRRAKRLGLKVVVDHCVPHPLSMKKTTGEPGYDEWWSFWNSVMKDCEAADVVIVGSQYVKDTFYEFGWRKDNIRVVKLGVLPHFSFAKVEYRKSGTLELIFTGAWAHHKGVEDIVDAIEILKNRGEAVHMTVLGGYSLDDKSYRRACSLKLPMDFKGHVVQEELKEYLSKADVYVFPSLRDGFAVSTFEGMGAELCLLTTKESSIPIRNGDDGFVVPAHNPIALADKIAWLNRNRDVIEKVGRVAADEVAKEYTWENYARNLKDVYNELLNGGIGQV